MAHESKADRMIIAKNAIPRMKLQAHDVMELIGDIIK